jgi:very-short-patch-repair endonuclease
VPTIAQRLRRNPTIAEVRLWRLIQPLRTQFHFRKQVRLGRYVVDFASHKAKLVVEIDGDTHYVADGPEKDRLRDRELEAHGYRVLRFTNLEVMSNPEGVWTVLVGVLEATDTKIPPS